jgi:hypothetical protein
VEQPGETDLSVQVLQELHVNLCKHGLPATEAATVVRRQVRRHIVDNTLDLLQAALDEQAHWPPPARNPVNSSSNTGTTCTRRLRPASVSRNFLLAASQS